ncbi:hypothetical protein SEVIR_1G086100v4 [Setaria viridis]|uniref:Homeobox domain-containing protein n=1 Tax=Setaria viridis TaxID=4556 RepID=A0A4U6W7Z7_SETVI|nr:putative homeobox-leucine zipper protein HOX26 [Setaria viridis]TKW37995.1 hypothetical protein SEVIR_1G086100v2 [Setaria viridis]
MSSVTTAGSAEEHPVSVEEFVGAHLSLGIGGGEGSSRSPQQQGRPRTVQLFGEVLSLQVDDEYHDGARRREPAAAAGRKKRDHSGSGARQNKKARTFQDGGDGGGGGGRKKLRLTGAQAAMLEDSFRAHNILSHAEKQELARRVGLSARQVEVWFQNRRARTKLKQTEVDCELLHRWCDRLTDENARLRRDLADLRASATARLAVCAACCDKQVDARAGEMA